MADFRAALAGKLNKRKSPGRVYGGVKRPVKRGLTPGPIMQGGTKRGEAVPQPVPGLPGNPSPGRGKGAPGEPVPMPVISPRGKLGRK